MTAKRVLAGVLVGAAVLSACGSSSKKVASSGSASTASESSPATRFSVAKAGSVGPVVVDGRGRTVYVLTADGKTGLPCTDDSGCTKAWPDLALPDGVSAAKAGTGLDGSLLGTKKVGTENYATYNGWLLYEFSGDSTSGQANGEGIKSFGGTWYALDAKGSLVMPGATATTAGSGGNGY